MKQHLDISRFTIQKTRGSNWSDTLDQILEKVNPPRIQAGFQKISHKMLAKQLSRAGYNTGGKAHGLLQECEKAEKEGKCAFGQAFWTKLRN